MSEAVAYRSIDQLVLVVWEQSEAEHEQFAQLMDVEQLLLGRCFYTRYVGLGRREEIVGLEHRPDLDVPTGWAVWHRRHFLRPQAGPAGDPARIWLAHHQPPVTPEELLAPYGVSPYVVADGFVHWPGLERLDDGLYLTWPVDVGWDGGESFERVSLSAYHAAKERASDPASAASTPGA